MCDNENHVVSKKDAKWDSVKEAWTPYFKLDITYNTNEVAMNYAFGNDGRCAFDKNMEKSTLN